MKWAPVLGASGFRVSDTGVVESLHRAVETRTGIRHYRGTKLAPTRNRSGHLKVWVRLDTGEKKLLYVHRLVMEAFIGAAEGRSVAHNDGNPANNTLGNLRYATAVENSADMVGHGTRLSRERHPRAKLTEQDVAWVKSSLRSGARQKDLAASLGVARTTVSAISASRSWAD